VDLLIGGTSTAAARFAVLNINSGTPVASVSAQDGSNKALSLWGDGSIQSARNNTLTIGGDKTGNIVLTPNNGTGGLVTVNSNLNLSTGNAYQIAGLSVLSGLTLGNGVTQSSLTKVGTISTGTWIAAVIGSQYGGTGADLSTSAQGTVPYFSATGVMSALAVGTSGQCLTTTGAAANPSWLTCALGNSTNWWTANTSQGTLYPINSTLDLLLGGTATTSAKIGFLNIAGSLTPTASISAAGAAIGSRTGLVLGADATIQSLQKQNLTLGGNTRGGINFTPGNIQTAFLSSIGRIGMGTVTNPIGLLDISGNAGNNATLMVNNSTASGDIFTASSSGVTKFVIDNAGKVGIGTRTPRGLLDIAGNITFDNQTSLSGQTGSPVNFSHTTGTGGNRMLIVAVTTDVSIRTVSSITYNGVSLAPIPGCQYTSYTNLEMWYLANPSSGSNTVSITLNGSGTWIASAVSYSGVAQTDPFRASCQTESGSSGTDATLDVTSQYGDKTIDLINYPAFSPTLAAGSGQTDRWNVAYGGGNYRAAYSDESAAGATTNMGWAIGGASGNWDHIGVAMKPLENVTLLVGSNAGNDILAASSSGTTKFRITNGGNLVSVAGAQWLPLTNSSTALQIANAAGTAFMNFDTTASRIGMGTVSSPKGLLDISGDAGNNATLMVNNSTANGDIFTASASGTTKFRLTNDGSALFQGNTLLAIGNGGSGTGSNAVVNAIGDQGSRIPNASFESNYIGATFADGWVTDATSSATTTFTRDTSVFAHGDASAKVVINNGSGAFYSSCVPISVVSVVYYLSYYAQATGPIPTVRGYLDQYTSKAACQADTAGSRTVSIPISTTITTSWAKYGTAVTLTAGNYWGRVHFFIACNAGAGPCANSTVNIDGVILSSYQTNVYIPGLDYAENYPADPSHVPEAGDVVSLTSANGVAVVSPSEKYMDQGTIGVVSTEPGYVLDDGQMPEPKVPVALAGRVPVKVSSKNGEIHIGDYLASSDIPGVAVRAITAGPVIGKAMENYTDPDPAKIGKVMMFIKNTYIPFAPISIAMDGNLSLFSSPVSSEAAALALGLPGVPAEPGFPTGANNDPVSSASSSGSFDLASDANFVDLKNKVASVERQIEDLRGAIVNSSTQSAFLASINSQPAVLGASTSADFVSNLQNLDIQSATISGDLMVLGRTTLADLGVTGNIAAGLLSVHGLDSDLNNGSGGASINSIGDLNLQNNGLGGINILAGKVLIDKDGNIKTEGTITAKKIEANNFTVLGQDSIGSGTIPAGTTSIEISTPVASESSKIFLTSTSLTTLQLTVVKKSDGKFKVGIPVPTTSPISFDWWIVGNRNN
ncbi:MAG: hypothetical protein A3C97_03240, partial [Candidatus Levybacteria bacterium RIFCSPHIGHO2_02_FULL_37_11]